MRLNIRDYILRSNEGFTLLEVLVVLFIMTMMISLFLANYNTGNNSNNLSLGAQQLASDIRTAQNKALGSVIYNGAFPLGGWGVHFSTVSTTKYTIFADVNGNRIYDVGEGSVAFGGQTLSLPPNVTVVGLYTNDLANPTPSSLDVTFLPPDPTTRIYDGIATSTVAKIKLRESIRSAISTTTVNMLGLIQVN